MGIAEYDAEIRRTASMFGVRPDIHPDDLMFQFYLKHDRDFHTGGIGVQRYFESGRDSARMVDELVHRFGPPASSRMDKLEFASGYGCVSRHFESINGNYNIVACDIHQKAIDFLTGRIGVEAILSDARPDKLHLGRRFPVIFALSFFSHMPDATWGAWLKTLFELLSQDGILIFTTHGANTARTWRADKGISSYWGSIELDERGYWFRPDSEQHDLPTEEYGTTIVTPKYVIGKISDVLGCDLIYFQEAMWWGIQDTYILKKYLL